MGQATRKSFKILTQFQYSTEAQIVKGRLEAEGIPVFLSDSLTIDVDPLVSHAIGGVKLKVYADDYLKAKYILNSISPYALDDHGAHIICPNCHGNQIQLRSTVKDLKSLRAFLSGFFFGTRPAVLKFIYRCTDCQYEFYLRND